MKYTLIGTTFLLCLGAVCAQAAAIETNAPPKNPWDASASLGATLTRGNTKTLMVSGQVQANKKWDEGKNEINLGADGVYGENEVTFPTGEKRTVRNAGSAHGYGQYNRLFTERFFGYFRVEALHDSIADIDYRLSLSPGVGYYFIKQTNLFLRGEVGPGYVFEKIAGRTDDYATLRVAERGEWKITPRAKLWEFVEYVPQIDKFDNYVLTAELGLDTVITKHLSQVTFLQNIYRSEPAPGRLHNDTRLVAGIKYTF